MQSRTGKMCRDKLVIYNWGIYIDPDLLTKFTKETGIKVQYAVIPTKLRILRLQVVMTYDIAVPSDYTIDKMVMKTLVKLPKIHVFDKGLV